MGHPGVNEVLTLMKRIPEACAETIEISES